MLPTKLSVLKHGECTRGNIGSMFWKEDAQIAGSGGKFILKSSGLLALAIFQNSIPQTEFSTNILRKFHLLREGSKCYVCRLRVYLQASHLIQPLSRRDNRNIIEDTIIVSFQDRWIYTRYYRANGCPRYFPRAKLIYKYVYTFRRCFSAALFFVASLSSNFLCLRLSAFMANFTCFCSSISLFRFAS